MKDKGSWASLWYAAVRTSVFWRGSSLRYDVAGSESWPQHEEASVPLRVRLAVPGAGISQEINSDPFFVYNPWQGLASRLGFRAGDLHVEVLRPWLLLAKPGP